MSRGDNQTLYIMNIRGCDKKVMETEIKFETNLQ